MSEELKPCPFCGGEAVMVADEQATGKGVDYRPECTACDAGFTYARSDETAVAAAWNRRDTTAIKQEREECANVVDAYRERYGGNWPALVEVAAAIRRRGE